MPSPLYFDVHVPVAIAHQLRRRGVDVLHAIEEETNQLEDDELLELSTKLRRVMVTQDIGFHVMAGDWVRQGKFFTGLFYGEQAYMDIGRWVSDLELIAKTSDVTEWMNSVNRIPL